MITCPKCGYKNNQPQAVDCPKCGIYYAKFQKAKEHFNAERELNHNLSKAMSGSVDEPSNYTDFEPNKDAESYPMTNFLSAFFVSFAGILIIFTIVEVKFVWGLLLELNESFKIFSGTDSLLKDSDILYLVLSVAFLGFLQVAIYFAIGCFLRLGKDIADNTRATRNYLALLAKTK